MLCAQVTLFGESAGAMSIGLHLLDPHNGYTIPLREREGAGYRDGLGGTLSPSRSRGRALFRAVILQSNPLGYKYRCVLAWTWGVGGIVERSLVVLDWGAVCPCVRIVDDESMTGAQPCMSVT